MSTKIEEGTGIQFDLSDHTRINSDLLLRVVAKNKMFFQERPEGENPTSTGGGGSQG